MSNRIRISPSRRTRAAIDALAAAAGCPASLVASLAVDSGMLSLMKDVSAILGPLEKLQAPPERVRAVLAIVTGYAPIPDRRQ